jgi:hypothetical protein
MIGNPSSMYSSSLFLLLLTIINAIVPIVNTHGKTIKRASINPPWDNYTLDGTPLGNRTQLKGVYKTPSDHQPAEALEIKQAINVPCNQPHGKEQIDYGDGIYSPVLIDR